MAIMCPCNPNGKGHLKGAGGKGKEKGKAEKGNGKGGALNNQPAIPNPRPVCPNVNCFHLNLIGATKCAACNSTLKKRPTYLEAAAKAGGKGNVADASPDGLKGPNKQIRRALEKAECILNQAGGKKSQSSNWFTFFRNRSKIHVL